MSFKPSVLIVGAGIGGLSLGVLLERAGIPYIILERAKAIKPLGSALALGANVIPFFKQIGIYNEFMQHATVRHITEVYNEDRELEFMFDSRPAAVMGGYDGYIISRPAIYNILLKQIPADKIHLSSRVLQVKQDSIKASVTCANGSKYEADIIVGADGAYSGVRQSMYKAMMAQDRLPKSDQESLPYSCTCLVGQTRPLNPEEFLELKKSETNFHSVLSYDKPYTWVTITTKSNTICWMVVHHLDKVSSKSNDSFRNSEWGLEAAGTMSDKVRDLDLPITSGGHEASRTMGTLIDHTDKTLISKVTLEEKFFETWFDGRIVLMGDACHKMNPAGGQGAMNAMQDAITLANWINVLESNEVKEIATIFQEYRNERYPLALEAFESSRMFSKLIAKDFYGKIARLLARYQPKWLWLISLRKLASNRPQVAFLGSIEDRGTVKPSYQPSLLKTQASMSPDANPTVLIVSSEDTEGEAMSVDIA
ncbi:hypothetical protein B0O80DRAFT_137376 [Mortierella sp. GBAus27b]|nr:hypothetical protein B0O80DRAFT_137376 [Mortierella sp. GBAus27b]